jgi:predicted nucleotidyltransferase
MPSLVELGIVDRREAPPSALFRFVPDNIAARAVSALAGARKTVLEEIAGAAGDLIPEPASVIVFGSFARAEAVRGSDLDVVVVRADGIEEEDARWRESMAAWSDGLRRLTGNAVDVVEVSPPDAIRFLRSRKPLWLDVQRDGVAVFGADVAELKGRRSAKPETYAGRQRPAGPRVRRKANEYVAAAPNDLAGRSIAAPPVSPSTPRKR